MIWLIALAEYFWYRRAYSKARRSLLEEAISGD